MLCLQVRGLVKALTHHNLSAVPAFSLWCFPILLVPDQSNKRDAAANSSLLETVGLGLCKNVFLITNSQRAEPPAYESGAQWKIALWG